MIKTTERILENYLSEIFTSSESLLIPHVAPIQIYKNLKKYSNSSFVTELTYNNRRIAVVCCESLYNIWIKNNEMQIYDSNNQLICNFKGASYESLAHINFLFKDTLKDFECIGQSIFALVSYDMARQFENRLNYNHTTNNIPDIWAVVPKVALVIDYDTYDTKIVINNLERKLGKTEVNQIIRAYQKEILSCSFPKNLSNGEKSDLAVKPQFNISKNKFCKMVEKAKEYIKAGDIFQVVLSVEAFIHTNNVPEDIFYYMCEANRGTTNFLINTKEFSMIGATPEILVEKIGQKCIIKPLAGTIAHNGGKDYEKERELLNNEKNCAEHRMLVDLARNDLGRVCKYNSVLPEELMKIEYYYSVMHIVSKIIGGIEENKSNFDLFKACFPAGTMTGAPKIRAMEIIDELETKSRGFYAGGLGFFMANDDLLTSIVIRSITIIDNIAYARAGAGIVYDSIPEEEYYECLNKLQNALVTLSKGDTCDFSN